MANKISKNKYFILAIILIIIVYYYYLFYAILPLYESGYLKNLEKNIMISKNKNKENFENKSNKEIEFLLEDVIMHFENQGNFVSFWFHLFFFFFLYSFVRTSLNNPGNIPEEYNDVYSISLYYEFYMKFYNKIFLNMNNGNEASQKLKNNEKDKEGLIHLNDNNPILTTNSDSITFKSSKLLQEKVKQLEYESNEK